MAAEPVEVIVEGLEGDTLKNVQAGLALPPGLVQEGRVNPLWLKLCERQIPEKVRQALKPFGYYNPQIRVSLEAIQEGLFRLRVYVEPGDPLRVSSAKIELRGSGSQEQKLKAVEAFSKGDICARTNTKTQRSARPAGADISMPIFRFMRSVCRKARGKPASNWPWKQDPDTILAR
jgi:hypothetical protein